MLHLLIAVLALADTPQVEEPTEAAEPEHEHEVVLDLPTDAVVLLVQGPGTCSGAFIDDQGTVATAYHCVAPGGRPKITTKDGREGIGKVTGIDVSRDLAIVSVPDLAGSTWLEIREEPLVQGQRVWVIGHPYAVKEPGGFLEGTLRWSLSGGVLSAIGPKSIQFTAPVNPGNSGGPVVDDEGRLVGVVSRRIGGDGLGFAGRANGVQTLLDGEGRGFSPLGGTLGLEILVATWGDSFTVDVGARAEVSFRDRVIIGAAFAEPLSGRWGAARFGQFSWSEIEGRVGLRQRFMRGMWTSHIEVYGGVASIGTFTPDPEWIFIKTAEIGPMIGGAIGIAGNAVDLAFIQHDGEWIYRTLVVLEYPGTIWMF